MGGKKLTGTGSEQWMDTVMRHRRGSSVSTGELMSRVTTKGARAHLDALSDEALPLVLRLLRACLQANDQDGAEQVTYPLAMYVMEETHSPGTHLQVRGEAIFVVGDHSDVPGHRVSDDPGLDCACPRFRGEGDLIPGACVDLMLLAVMLATGGKGRPIDTRTFDLVIAEILGDLPEDDE
jgi:hypothetical protein